MSVTFIFVYTVVSLAAPFVLCSGAWGYGEIKGEVDQIKTARREAFTEYGYQCKEAKATGQPPPAHSSESATLRRKILLYRRRKNRVPNPLVGEPICPLTNVYIVQCGCSAHDPVKALPT